ncbi:MAG: DUF1441 family protein [Betaproteobacteria bacterium]|nr:DUF1441 family protein [Betaproteobacteria bacterium]
MKKDTNNTQLDGHLVSIRSLSALTGLDRDTIRTSISRAALKPAGTLGGYPAYLLRDALRALFVRHGDVDPATLTPHDRKALADARLREHTLHVKEGNYLPREAVRNGCAVAYQMVSQAIQSIPDLCERKTGADVETVELIGKVIDNISSDLAAQMEALHRESSQATT